MSAAERCRTPPVTETASGLGTSENAQISAIFRAALRRVIDAAAGPEEVLQRSPFARLSGARHRPCNGQSRYAPATLSEPPAGGIIAVADALTARPKAAAAAPEEADRLVAAAPADDIDRVKNLGCDSMALRATPPGDETDTADVSGEAALESEGSPRRHRTRIPGGDLRDHGETQRHTSKAITQRATNSTRAISPAA